MHTVHTVHALLSYEDFHGDSLSLPILMAIFQVFIEGNDDGSGGNNWSYKSFKAPVKSSPPTNQHPVFFTGRMSFLSPNQQHQSTDTFHGLAYSKLTWGLPTLSLTINSSWLPWGRVAMPLMPVVPQILAIKMARHYQLKYANKIG